jgi:hypothetical protein
LFSPTKQSCAKKAALKTNLQPTALLIPSKKPYFYSSIRFCIIPLEKSRQSLKNKKALQLLKTVKPFFISKIASYELIKTASILRTNWLLSQISAE